MAIKNGLGREDFSVDPRLLRRRLLENAYEELAVTGAHVVVVDLLPPIHKDPFDRLLVAQAQVEGVTLLTADAAVARYPGPIRRCVPRQISASTRVFSAAVAQRAARRAGPWRASRC